MALIPAVAAAVTAELTAEEAAEMSREEALRVLATAEDVPEKDRRVAELMLAGPEISFTEEQALLRRFPSKRPVLDVSVRAAMIEYAGDVVAGREQARTEVLELMAAAHLGMGL